MLYRIVSPYFVAGIVTEGNKVLRSAPIIAYSFKLGTSKFLAYCRRKGWAIEELGL